MFENLKDDHRATGRRTALLALNVDHPAVRLDDRPGDRQPQPRLAALLLARRIAAVESLKNVRQHL